MAETLGPLAADNAAGGFDAPTGGQPLGGGRGSKSLQVSRRQIAVSLGVDSPSGASMLKQTAISRGATSVVTSGSFGTFRAWRAKASRPRIEG